MISEFDKVQTYWPTFTFHYKYKNFKKDKSDLIKDIYKESSKQEKDIDSGVAEAAKYNLLESKLSFLYTDTTSIKKVKDFFYESFMHMIHEGLPSTGYWKPRKEMKCIMHESWYHITKQNGYHRIHSHPGSSWASIFYVKTSECGISNGNNTWYNHNMHHNSRDDGGDWNFSNGAFVIPPTEGDLIIFPAWLPHDAVPYRGTEDRIVISANANFLYGQ
jgi:uncharacterized protein (TIGR02466 family)|tara:strand:- start:599 stop:1252 length:654 start_codon:yes stop_codon:yes gene_type:complete